MSQKAMADVGLLVCGVEGAPLAIDQQQAPSLALKYTGYGWEKPGDGSMGTQRK